MRSNPALCNVLMLLSSPTTPKMTFSMTQGDVYVEMVLQRQSYITIILVFKIRFKILLYDSQLFSQFRYMKMTKLNQVKVTDLELRHHTTKPTIRLVRPTVGGWVVRRCHVSFVTRGVQLILAYSWARPAILVAGKGREVMFLFLLFLHFHSCFSFFPVPPFHLFCYLFCLFSPFLWETTQNDPQGLTCR